MSEALEFSDLSDLYSQIAKLLSKRAEGKLGEGPPHSFEDLQEQVRTAMRFVQLADSYKQKGNHWSAIAHLAANLRYYSSSADMGKCGHVLLEIADCLFLCKEIAASKACCHEAITLLIRSKDEHDWARNMAAIGELLLVSIELNTQGHKDAIEAMRMVRLTLSPKERRIFLREDAHRVSRYLISAYKTNSDGPLRELEKIPPKRKRTEEKNLQSILVEWTTHYAALKSCVERVLPEIIVNLPKRSEVASLDIST